jgi:hypothetical protein
MMDACFRYRSTIKGSIPCWLQARASEFGAKTVIPETRLRRQLIPTQKLSPTHIYGTRPLQP